MLFAKCRNVLKEIAGRLQKTACNKQMSPGCVFTCEVLDRQTTKKTNSVFLEIILFIYSFIYNNFICNNQYKKAAVREELNHHVR